jgi:magnesium chelatase subunit I
MAQEAHTAPAGGCSPRIPALFPLLIEEAARAARGSEFVDAQSGVSTRLTIAALEMLHANVLARGLTLGEARPQARLVDLPATLAAMTGKIELAYEGEQEGPLKVGWHVLSEALKALWKERLPPVIAEGGADERDQGPWREILAWFAKGNKVQLSDRTSTAEHEAALAAVPGLGKLADQLLKPPADERTLMMEFIVEGLFHGGALAREDSARGLAYTDLLAHMMRREGTKKRRRE